MAVTALIGGWNVIGHLEEAKAATKTQNNELAPGANATIADSTIKLPTPTPQPATLDMPDLAPLAVAPIPTLRPMSALLAGGVQGASQAGAGVAIQLPGLQALAPLPTMAPLPSLPSMPSAPTSSSGSGNSSSSGNSNSGGSTSGGGATSGGS